MGVLQDLEKSILSADKLNADGIPSASLAILEDGKISTHVITNGKENDETVYQACSISKPITALAVAKLIDEGRISYDTKVVNHMDQTAIDSLVDEKTAHLMQYITVGMCLSHTTGLPQSPRGFPGYVGDPPSVEHVLAGTSSSNTPKPDFLHFPGMKFQYSGTGTTIIQLVLENLMKKSFADLMDELVLQPLKMTRSWYRDLPPNEKNFTNAHYTPGFDLGHHRFVELAAAGLWTTPADLIKAISAVQHSLHTEDGFLTQATAKKMLTEVTPAFSFGMAMGWTVTDMVFAHSGSNEPGYNTYVVGARVGAGGPDDVERKKNGVAIMTNSAWGHEKCIKHIVNAIWYLKGWSRQKCLPTLFESDNEFAPYPAPEGTAVVDGWKEWIGKWEGDFDVVDDGGPAVVFKSFPPTRLRPGATPVSKLEKGKQEFVFVVDGLKLGMRLTWEDDKQIIQLMQSEPKTLKRR